MKCCQQKMTSDLLLFPESISGNVPLESASLHLVLVFVESEALN